MLGLVEAHAQFTLTEQHLSNSQIQIGIKLAFKHICRNITKWICRAGNANKDERMKWPLLLFSGRMDERMDGWMDG